MPKKHPHGLRADGTPYRVPPGDLRRRPRKAAGKLLCRAVKINVSETEFAAIHELATREEMTLRDLIVGRLLGKEKP